MSDLSMTDFSIYHKGNWRDGQVPKTDGATHVVYSDTRHYAYDVPPDEVGDFLEWVADTFPTDNDPMYGVAFDGSVQEYLDFIDVSVREV